VIQFTGTTPALINTTVGGDYLINNAIYAEEEVPIVVNLNDAEERAGLVKLGRALSGFSA
jgi:hypothetical protein